MPDTNWRENTVFSQLAKTLTTMKCIIAGPRDYTDQETAFKILDKIFINRKPDHVICGGSTGMDEIGRQWAYKNNIGVMHFPADWEKYGKSAGPRRNKEMALYATHCVVIWQGKSPGSKNMIETAKKHNLILREVLL